MRCFVLYKYMYSFYFWIWNLSFYVFCINCQLSIINYQLFWAFPFGSLPLFLSFAAPICSNLKAVPCFHKVWNSGGSKRIFPAATNANTNTIIQFKPFKRFLYFFHIPYPPWINSWAANSQYIPVFHSPRIYSWLK